MLVVGLACLVLGTYSLVTTASIFGVAILMIGLSGTFRHLDIIIRNWPNKDVTKS